MPYFKFSQFSGRLAENNRLMPLYPIKPIPLETAEVPTIKFDTIKTQAVKNAAATGEVKPKCRTLNPKNLEFMKKLQSDLEAPVYLAKGMPDKILFGITCALVGFGFFESMRFFYNRATKKI